MSRSRLLQRDSPYNWAVLLKQITFSREIRQATRYMIADQYIVETVEGSVMCCSNGYVTKNRVAYLSYQWYIATPTNLTEY